MFKRVLSIILCVFLLVVTLTACGEDKFVPAQKAFNKKVQPFVFSDGEVFADDGNLKLIYDADYSTVKLCDNNGNVWDICPEPQNEANVDELGMPLMSGSFTNSAIEVSFVDSKSGVKGLADTYADVSDGIGRIVCKKINNGVTIEYYFDKQEFMIPVDYVLKDGYLSVSIDSKRIQENDKKVTAVTLTPFICSIENNTPGAYLFYPSGSGALIDSKTINTQGYRYNAYVYGDDLTMEEEFSATNETSVRMPVYGFANGSKGGFAIIDQGADATLLKSSSGSERDIFSAVYPSFQLRGYTSHKAKTFSNEQINDIFPDNMLQGTFSIRFYPLVGADKANYTEMANIYRNYLIKEKGLKANADDKALSVNLLGGTMITKSFLGVPYQTLHTTTSVDDANKIITELSNSVNGLAVKLKGYGTTGVDIGKIGGGFKIGGNIGSKSDLKDLAALCKNKKVDLYMDYDLVRFSSSGSGFSNFSDVVMNSGYIKSEQYIFDRAMRDNLQDKKYRLLRPIRFSDAVSKAVDKNADFYMPGISLDTLSSLSYSDYSDYNKTVEFNAKYGFENAVSKAISQIKTGKQKYMASEANVYAALAADIISETPVSSDNGHAFTEDVPFYAMVFKGYRPMTSASVNTASNSQKTILAAIEGGVGLNYTLISEWDNVLIDSSYPDYYSTVYSNVKDDMINTYKKYAGYYESIKGKKILSSEIIAEGVHRTVFEGNVEVYVNYNSNAVDTPAGTIEKLDCKILGGEA